MSNGIQRRVGHSGHFGENARNGRDRGRYQGDVPEEANHSHDNVRRPSEAEEADDGQHGEGHLHFGPAARPLPLSADSDLRGEVHEPSLHRTHGDENPDVRVHDQHQREAEVADHQNDDVRPVLGPAGEVVEGAGGADALQDEVAPPQQRGGDPQHRHEPDDRDDQQGCVLGYVVHGAHPPDHHRVAVVGDGGQRVDRHQARRARRRPVYLAH